MKPILVLVVSFAVFLGLGHLGVHALAGWVVALRWALVLMFLFNASAHLAPVRADLVRMVPPYFPKPGLLVAITGGLEIAGAIGLLIPAMAPVAATALALLLLAMFPANVHAARRGVTLRGAPATPLVPRTVL